MVFVIILLVAFGCAHGQDVLPWWSLPAYYLNGPIQTINVTTALQIASVFDPNFRLQNYVQLAATCYQAPIPPGSTLTIHQAAAINCYTAPGNVTRAVNYALRSLYVVNVLAWSGFLKFFHDGVAQLAPKERPNQICRGDPNHYPNPPNGSIVTLPLSWSDSLKSCQLFAGDPSTNNCTIARLYNYVSEKSIKSYSAFPIEEEYIMLPGTLGVITDIIPQNPKACRSITIYEIDATKIPRTTNVSSLIPAFPFTDAESNNYDMTVYTKLTASAHASETRSNNTILEKNNTNPH